MATLINTRKIMQNAVDNREPFKRGNLSAERLIYPNNHPNWGILPDYLRDQYRAVAQDKDMYVVFSYATPIGWVQIGQSHPNWYVPSVKYSSTTTHHQSLLRVMTDNHGFYQQFSSHI